MTTRRQFILTGVCLGSGLSLLSCAPPPEAPSFPDIRFTGEPPFMLQASQVEIRTRYQPGDADNAFPVSPLRAIQNWARDRLRASGQGGPARFTIADATAKITDSTRGPGHAAHPSGAAANVSDMPNNSAT